MTLIPQQRVGCIGRAWNWRTAGLGAASVWLVMASAVAVANDGNLSCNQVTAMKRMITAKSPAALATASRAAPSTSRSRLVKAARLFQLRPRSHAAATAFLSLLPKSDDAGGEWNDFGSLLCEQEPVKVMGDLEAFGSTLSSTAASAVLVAPERMDDYVAAAQFLVSDPHSDFAAQMGRVCRRRQEELAGSFERLPATLRDWYVAQVFDPGHCRTLRRPEAE